MRIVVIGASGNVGTALLRDLGRQAEVNEIVGFARRLPKLELPKVTWQTGDVVDADLDALFDGADAVVHLAWAIQPARDRERTYAVDVVGSRRVFHAAGRAGVGTLVHASSVGAYSPGPHDSRVEESWPCNGIGSSFYSVDKAAAERELDQVEAAFPTMRTVRLRPGIVMQRGAAEEIRRFFLGPFVPNRLIRPGLIPLLPAVQGVAFQAVHADDLAQAYRRAVLDPAAHGAYNVAAEAPLDLKVIAKLLRARTIPISARLARAAAALTYDLRLHPTPPGWLDLGVHSPFMDTTRIREELGWAPQRTAIEALRELLDGLHDGAGDHTPPLAAHRDAPGRLHEVATGVGARSI